VKKRWLRFLLLGLGAYLFFLAATFPAAYAHRIVRDGLSGVTLSGVEGTIWSGNVRHLQAGVFQLQDLHWKVKFWPLLLGRLELALDSRDKEVEFKTRVGRSLGGSFYLSELYGSTSMASLQQMTPYRMPVLQGKVLFEGMKAVLAQGKLVEAEGTIRWQGATIKMGSPLELGNFSIELETGDQQVTGRLRDTGGPLQAEGSLKITQEGAYQFEGTFIPRNGSSELARKLRMLGAPDANGGYTLNYAGQLPIPLL